MFLTSRSLRFGLLFKLFPVPLHTTCYTLAVCVPLVKNSFIFFHVHFPPNGGGGGSPEPFNVLHGRIKDRSIRTLNRIPCFQYSNILINTASKSSFVHLPIRTAVNTPGVRSAAGSKDHQGQRNLQVNFTNSTKLLRIRPFIFI